MKRGPGYTLAYDARSVLAMALRTRCRRPDPSASPARRRRVEALRGQVGVTVGDPMHSWELEHGAWCRLEPLLSRPEAEALIRALLSELDWASRRVVLFGRSVAEPRLVAWAGALPYRYSGQTLPARAEPPCLRELWERVCAQTGVRFNHVLANQYRNGGDHMGYHADNEPELGESPTVACVSLGAERDFVFRLKMQGHRPRPDPTRHTVRLPSGSLFVMGGTFQHWYRHALPPRRRLDAVRVSLTFRKLLRAPSHLAETKGSQECSW